MQHNGNSKTEMGEIVSGDVDDWILARLNIPSVTVELGTEADY